MKLIRSASRFIVGLVLLFTFCSTGARAQTTSTPAPALNTAIAAACTDTAEPCANFQLSSGYMAASGIAMNNGLTAEMVRRMTKHAAVELFSDNLSDPTNAVLANVFVEARYSLSHLIRPSSQFDTKPIILTIGLGPGALKSPDGHTSFAAGVRIAVDYRLPGNTFVRPIDYVFDYSSGLANHNTVLHSNNQIGVTFGKYF